MTYRKVGGLHFVKLGRFGFSFYWSRRRGWHTKPANNLHRAWLHTEEILNG